MLSVSKIIENFQLVNFEEVSDTLIYLGYEGFDGNWYVKKMDLTSGLVFTNATVKNNSDYKNYSSAWTDRATLDYGSLSQAF